jgi:hypothetical protein
MTDKKLEMILDNLGLNLYIYRIYRRRSLEAAARAAEISPALLKRIEKGQYPNCRVSTTFALAQYYKISAHAVWETF